MSKGRRKKKGDAIPFPFAPFPLDRTKAVMVEQSALGFRVWAALCLQCTPYRNGTGKLCRLVIKEHGLGSQRDVTAATKKLIEFGRIVKTRAHRQRTCALYGVTHLPLNLDALAKEGLSDNEIKTVQTKFSALACDTNNGSANRDTTVEALNSRTDNRGSAKPLEQPLALPPRNRIDPISPPLSATTVEHV